MTQKFLREHLKTESSEIIRRAHQAGMLATPSSGRGGREPTLRNQPGQSDQKKRRNPPYTTFDRGTHMETALLTSTQLCSWLQHATPQMPDTTGRIFVCTPILFKWD